MTSISLEVILRDTDDEINETTAIRVIPESIMPNGALGLSIHPAGTGTCDGDDYAPIFLERHNGEIRLIVWGDINDSEPSHIITLQGARHEALREEDKTYPFDVAVHSFPMKVRAGVGVDQVPDLRLTVGKEYEVIDEEKDGSRRLGLCDDNNDLCYILAEFFVVVYPKVTITIVEISDGMFDMYDDNNGNCLIEDRHLLFLPTWHQVEEFLRTDHIVGAGV